MVLLYVLHGVLMADNRQTRVWVEKARRGDALAASKLLAMYHPVLRSRAEARMTAALRAKMEPEDVLQQVYVDAFRHLGRFEHRDPGSFLNWVLTILDHKLVDLKRALHRQVREIARERDLRASGEAGSYWSLLDQLYADSVTPSRVVRHEEAVGALLTCISRLSDSHRQVIQLRFLEGLPVSEVAACLDKTEAAVVALSKRALKALRQSMDRLGDFSRGA